MFWLDLPTGYLTAPGVVRFGFFLFGECRCIATSSENGSMYGLMHSRLGCLPCEIGGMFKLSLGDAVVLTLSLRMLCPSLATGMYTEFSASRRFHNQVSY